MSFQGVFREISASFQSSFVTQTYREPMRRGSAEGPRGGPPRREGRAPGDGARPPNGGLPDESTRAKGLVKYYPDPLHTVQYKYLVSVKYLHYLINSMVSKRRKYGKRRFNRRTRRSIKRVVKRVLSQAAEKKIAIATLPAAFSSITSTWTERWLTSSIVLGTDDFQRIGRKIRVLSIEVHGTLQNGYGGATGDVWNQVRFHCGLWRYNTSVSNPLAADAITFNNPISKNGFGTTQMEARLIKNYKDKTINFNPPHTFDNAGAYQYTFPVVRSFKWYKRFKKPVVITYDSAGNPRSDILMAVMSDSLVASNPGFINGWLKIMYDDI